MIYPLDVSHLCLSHNTMLCKFIGYSNGIEFTSRVKQPRILIFSRVRSENNYWKVLSHEWNSLCNIRKIIFSVCYIFFVFWHVSLKSKTLLAIHDVTSQSLVICTLWKKTIYQIFTMWKITASVYVPFNQWISVKLY